MSREPVEDRPAVSNAAPPALAAFQAVLAPDGTVLAANPAWLGMAGGAARALPYPPIGENYLDAWRAIVVALGDDDARREQAAAALRGCEAVLAGRRAQLSLEYPLRPDQPHASRWFALDLTAIGSGGIGAVVSYRETTERMQSELWVRSIARDRSGAGEGLMLVDLGGRIVHVDSGWAGMQRAAPRDLLGLPASTLYPPEEFEARVRPVWDAARTEGEQHIEALQLRADGSIFPVAMTVVLARDGREEPLGLIITAADITERRAAEEALRRQEAWFRALVQGGSDLIAVLNQDGSLRYVSPSAGRVLGRELGARAGAGATLDLQAIIHPDDLPRVLETLQGWRRRTGSHPPITVRFCHQEGGWRRLEVVATNLIDDAAVEGIVINARDVTERATLEEELRRRAYHDALTGLPNRALFLHDLARALVRAETGAEARSVGVLFLDLDGFKLINDSLGHRAGDALLAAVAERLSVCIDRAGSVARFGGDEFAVLIEEMAGLERAQETAQAILAALRAPFTIDGHEVVIQTSIGIAGSPPTAATPELLLQEADIALYQAKTAGRGQAVTFDPAMAARVLERLRLETELRHAQERGQLHLVYQPILDVVGLALRGVEALLRWEHPQRGAIGPRDFIPLAEETGLILPIGAWVLREACVQMARWREQPAMEEAFVAVNVSVRQLQHPEFVDEVARVLAETGLPPACLSLEIGESPAMQHLEATIATLTRLGALGVKLAIDDFGTDYSSLNYLRRFPVNTLKVDRSFITGLEDGGTMAILQAISAVGHALGMAVSAEGVESAAELAAVRELGFDRCQGMFVAPPAPAAELPAAFARGRLHCHAGDVHVA